jgi:hypothetical protein
MSGRGAERHAEEQVTVETPVRVILSLALSRVTFRELDRVSLYRVDVFG